MITLNGNNPTTGSGTWSTTSGATITDPTDPNTTVSNLTAGNNLFVWTITSGTCVSTDTIIVYANANPVANAGSDAFITSGLSVIIGG